MTIIPPFEHTLHGDAPAAPERSRQQPHTDFSGVLERALNTPPFSPWPVPAPDTKTPLRNHPAQTADPIERNRRHGERQRRG